MDTLLKILHHISGALRLAVAQFHGAIYRYGPATLARHTMLCGWLVCSLCLCVAGYDLMRRRSFDALLWAVMLGLLFTAFWLVNTPLGSLWSANLAVAVLAIAIWLLGRALWQRFRATPKPRQAQ